MPALKLSPTLRADYLRLFQNCRINSTARDTVTALADQLATGKPRYQSIGNSLGIPWCFIGLVHYRECNLSFDKHLHNGDPLNARTVHEPKNRPAQGTPPFRFEDSARDALLLQQLDRWQDWSLPGMLYQLEAYNGFGYRLYHPEVLTPYLWGQSNLYSQGGFPKDGVWSGSYVNRQLGVAVLLRRLSERGHVSFAADGSLLPDQEPVSVWQRFAGVRYDPEQGDVLALELQHQLNKIAGIHIQEDGKAGERTSTALFRVTGHYLPGDPRATAG